MPETKKTVCVIGAGMIGVTSASFLQRDGHDVFLLDPNPPGESTSSGNAGCLNSSSVVPMAMPGMLRHVPRWLFDPMGPLVIRWRHLPVLLPWLTRFLRSGTKERVRAQARALRALLAPSIATLAPLAKDAGVADLVRSDGVLFVYRSEQSWLAESAAWRLRRENGVSWEVLEGAALQEAEPALSPDYAKGILVRDNGHTPNPHRLVRSLAEEFRRRGGRIDARRATEFDIEDGRLKAVRTNFGTVPADLAVIAAGIWSKPLAAQLGNKVPLQTERGYHLMISGPEAVPRRPTADAAAKFVATPMELGLRIAGTVELARLGSPPNWERAMVLLRHVKRLFPGLRTDYPEERLSTWMGNRPSLPDSLPVIGRSRRASGIVYAFGHGHIGMAAAPMTAKVVSELVSGRPTSIDIGPFRPERF
jgi:glycine/D-amino acid oxidase-like deaminating enzyme